MRAFGCTVMVCVPMCLSRFLIEVVITRGTYGMLVPMNSYIPILTEVLITPTRVVCNGPKFVSHYPPLAWRLL